MVAAAADYPWSSHRANGMGAADSLLTPHPVFAALGPTAAARRDAYRALFRDHLDDHRLAAIRSALQTGTPLGNDRFRDQIERTLKVKVGHAQRGRPRSKPRQKGLQKGP